MDAEGYQAELTAGAGRGTEIEAALSEGCGVRTSDLSLSLPGVIIYDKQVYAIIASFVD